MRKKIFLFIFILTLGYIEAQTFVNSETAYNVVTSNGIEVNSGSTVFTSIPVSSLNLVIGEDSTGIPECFNGKMDEFSILNKSLSTAEILNNYKIFYLTSLEANFNFNQEVADDNNTGITTLIDFSSNNNDGILTEFTLTGTSSNWVSSDRIRNFTYYQDIDEDGFGNPMVSLEANEQPVGYVENNTDCDDTIATINPGVTEVCWNGLDDNCDGNQSEGCVPVVVNMATANNSVLPSFATAIAAVPYTYLGTNEYRFRITNNQTGIIAEIISPTRFVVIPSNMRNYNISYTITASAVINGELVPYAGNTIIVNSPVVNLVNLVSTSCGVTLASLSSNISTTVGLNAIVYTFRARLTSDNGPTPTYYTVQSASRFVSMNSFIGLVPQYGESYSISVQYQFFDIVSELMALSGYGEECIVTMPNIPTIRLNTPTCGITLTSMGTTISAIPAANALQYEFRIRLTSDNGPTPTYHYTTPNSSRFSSLSSFQGLVLDYSTSYTVDVRYKILYNLVELWSGYGAACQLTTPYFPVTEVYPLQCGISTTDLNQTFNIVVYPGFPTYKITLSEQVGEDFIEVGTINRVYSNFNLNMFTGVQLNKQYSASVSILLNGVFGPEGKGCDISTFASIGRTIEVPFTAVAYPNPFANSFLLDVKTPYNNTPIDIRVYDMLGRIVEQKQANVSELETTTIGDRYPSGVYNVIVTQGEETRTVRVMKR